MLPSSSGGRRIFRIVPFCRSHSLRVLSSEAVVSQRPSASVAMRLMGAVCRPVSIRRTGLVGGSAAPARLQNKRVAQPTTTARHINLMSSSLQTSSKSHNCGGIQEHITRFPARSKKIDKALIFLRWEYTKNGIACQQDIDNPLKSDINNENFLTFKNTSPYTPSPISLVPDVRRAILCAAIKIIIKSSAPVYVVGKKGSWAQYVTFCSFQQKRSLIS